MDLISRQDVFDMIDAVFREECEKRNTTYEEADEMTQWYLCGMMKVMEKVFDIPSASRWIPVRERLPKENKIVLITFDERVEMGRMRGESWEWLFESGWNYWVDVDNVTAWMPLPEPYKEEE